MDLLSVRNAAADRWTCPPHLELQTESENLDSFFKDGGDWIQQALDIHPDSRFEYGT